MLVCGQCGADNPIGRVFCESCGARLDLNHVTNSALVQARQAGWFARNWGKLVVLFVVVLLGAGVAAALVPVKAPLGPVGARGEVRRVDGFLGVLRRVRPGRTVGATISGEAINAYLAYRLVPRMRLEAASVAVGSHLIRLRIVQSSGSPVGMGSVKWTPTFSYDLLLAPAGDRLVVRKAVIGRLPLPGPLKGTVANKIEALFRVQPEWASFKYVSAIDVKEGKVLVEASRDRR